MKAKSAEKAMEPDLFTDQNKEKKVDRKCSRFKK